MRARRPILVLCAAAAVVVGLAACEDDEFAVLIEARSQGDIGVLEVAALRQSDGSLVGRTGPSYIGRTSRDINAGEPIRLVVQLRGPDAIVVHVRGCSGADCRASDRVFVATRCYDVAGVVRDSIILYGPLDEAQDRDRDGYPVDPLATCVDPPVDAPRDCAHACAMPALDCNGCLPGEPSCRMADDPGSDPTGNTIHPGAIDFCQDGVDQDCSGGDAPCGDADGDGWPACASADATGCDCNDSAASIHPDVPASEESCEDRIDRNCDGDVPECDNDGDGYYACGLSVSGGCDCDDAAIAVNPGASEVCEPEGTPPVDNDCDGLLDELPECRPNDRDGDGSNVCTAADPPGSCDCNDCDPGVRPGRADRCGDGIDADCDGSPRPPGFEEPCPTNDHDADGQTSAASGGEDCNDDDRSIYFDAPERCGDGIAQSCRLDVECGTGTDTDLDFYLAGADCNDSDASVWPGAPGVGDYAEACNGRDDDCDGVQDESLSEVVGCTLQSRDRRVASDPVYGLQCSGGVCRIDYRNNVLHCGGCGVECNVDGVNAADTCIDGVCDCAGEPDVGGLPAACAGGPPSTCCPGDGSAGSAGCKNLTNDPTNCGRCGTSCAGPIAGRPKANECSGGGCRCAGGPPVAGDDSTHACCTYTDAGGVVTTAVVDVTSDARNCGSCGNRCGPNSTCVGGRCECAAPFLDCDTVRSAYERDTNGCEIDPRTDPRNCGACTIVCSRPNATAICAPSAGPRAGECRIGMCNPLAGDCDMRDDNGCETSLTSTTNCGGCGVGCARANATPTCATGTCAISSCTSGWGNCDGVDPTGCETQLNSLTNCGSCGAPCDLGHATETCASGACALVACDGGWGNCDGLVPNGCETQLNTLTNCTACGMACDVPRSTESCSTGACIAGTCDPLWADCTGMPGCETPINTLTDCGACSMSCSRSNAMATCATGACAIASCNGGWGSCDGMDANGCETQLNTLTNCGVCMMSCSQPNATATCATGSCAIATCNTGYADCAMGGGCETSTTTTTNCGACAAACGTGETCATNRCECGSTRGGMGAGRACPAGQVCCSSSSCVNLTNDAMNCGACGNVCGVGETCSAGRCRCGTSGPTGAAGAEACTGATPDCCAAANVCVDRTTSTSHCGACGVACASMESCSGGRCTCGADQGSVGGGSPCMGGQVCCGTTLACRPMSGC